MFQVDPSKEIVLPTSPERKPAKLQGLDWKAGNFDFANPTKRKHACQEASVLLLDEMKRKGVDLETLVNEVETHTIVKVTAGETKTLERVNEFTGNCLVTSELLIYSLRMFFTFSLGYNLYFCIFG